MNETFLSVGQVNTYIKDIFNSEVMLQNICVFGEVSSYNISGGNAYFNIKDEMGLLSCVLFGANNFEAPKIGDMILVRGSVSYYAKGGKLSFNAYSIIPYGKGMLYEKFLKLKAELQSRGYFDEERKKSIPKYIKKIGVVTSETGAVIHDIIDVTTRRNNSIDIVLYPVKVQGVGAENEIAKGINFFSNYEDIDVIIVARGGGSQEDLEPFNTEIVANAVFNCSKPLVSAVGHETDFTIIDFVSDLRAPTPSAAAEIVAWEKDIELENINKLMLSIYTSLINKIKYISKEIDYFTEKIDNISSSKINLIINKIDQYRNKLYNYDSFVDNKIFELNKIELMLEGLNPIRLSTYGYSKIIQDNKAITSIKDVNVNKNLKISLIDGNINCKVVEK